ncbi:MAG: hypothetical protein NT069_18205 [Planctomycetota bacterium]|nr:hypothetical protein [Planctomycetota bacterium]
MAIPTDSELLAFLDEGLPVERMSALEQQLRDSEPLRQRLARLRSQQDAHGHTVSEIWRRNRLSCPTRHQLGSFLLGVVSNELADYVEFHLRTVGCRVCAANLDDLRSANQGQAEVAKRRQRFFQSSAGYVRRDDGN